MILSLAPRRGLPTICRSLQPLQYLSTRAAAISSSVRTLHQSRGQPRRNQRDLPVQTESFIQEVLASDINSPDYLSFQHALAEGNLTAVLRTYPSLMWKKVLSAQDGMDIIRLFLSLNRKKQVVEHEIKSFLGWYKKRHIPHHPRSNLFLLSYFKETKKFEQGLEFWSWLNSQPHLSQHIDNSTFGAAIELLADAGKNLEEIEDVYSEALQRTSGFSAYHLSPGAILQDRDQPANLRDTSMTLIQGIIRARLANKDWLNAYLALDTALRLHPHQLPYRFLTSFLQWRPITESFEVFCCLCRAGNPVNPIDFTTILNQLVTAQTAGSTDEKDLRLALAMVSALHHMIGANQGLSSIHLGVMLKGMFRMFPVPDTPFTKLQQEQVEQLSMKLFDTILSIFSRLSVRPETSTINQMLTAAGDIKNTQFIQVAISCVDRFALTPNEVTFFRAVQAAGRVGSVNQVQRWWAEWVKRPDIIRDNRSWDALAWAFLDAERPELFAEAIVSEPTQHQAELKKMFSGCTERRRQLVEKAPPGILSMPHEQFTKCMTNVSRVTEALKNLDDLIANKEVQDFQAHPPKRSSINPFDTAKQDAWQSALYEELTADKSLQRTERHDLNRSHLTMTSTNLSLGTTRYQNFSSINTLLLSARRFEAEEIRRELDSETMQIPFKTNVNVKHAERVQRSIILRTQLTSDINLKREIQEMDKDQWRNEIMALRARGKGSVSRIDETNMKYTNIRRHVVRDMIVPILKPGTGSRDQVRKQ